MKPPVHVARQFGQAVRKLRIKKSMTQQQLADSCGVDIGYIGQIERGLRNPSLGVIHSIASVLHVSVMHLIRTAKI